MADRHSGYLALMGSAEASDRTRSRGEPGYLQSMRTQIGVASTVAREAVRLDVIEPAGEAARRNILEPAQQMQNYIEREASRRIIMGLVPNDYNPVNMALRAGAQVAPRQTLGAAISFARAYPELTATYALGPEAGRFVHQTRELAAGVSETAGAIASYVGDRLRAGVESLRDAQTQARAAVSNALGRYNLGAEINAQRSGQPAQSPAVPARRNPTAADMAAEERDIQAAERARAQAATPVGRERVIPNPYASPMSPNPRMMLGGPTAQVDATTVAVNDLRTAQRAALADRAAATARGDTEAARAASERVQTTLAAARDRASDQIAELPPLKREWTRQQNGKAVTVHRKNFWR
jgi:hypothetical protein